jgi:cell wall assembly regulator SMI1
LSLDEAFEEWDRAEAALRRLAPEIAASLRSPASMDQLLETEKLIGEQFPDFVRAAYLRHDGQVLNRRVAHYLLMPTCIWLELAEVNEFWKEQREANDDFFPTMTAVETEYMSRIDNCVIRNVSFHRGHIPIGSSWAGDNFYLDLAPGVLGVRGQVFGGAADDFFPRETEAASLERYLQNLIQRLEEGSVVYAPDTGLFDPSTGMRVYSVATSPKRMTPLEKS